MAIFNMTPRILAQERWKKRVGVTQVVTGIRIGIAEELLDQALKELGWDHV